MTFWVIVFGSLLVFLSVGATVALLPLTAFQPKPVEDARPYTPLEQRGRDLYIANGCTYCHSQFTRPQDNNVGPGSGALRPSRAGDYFYDRPHLLGTERTGPDLHHEAGKHPDDWHLAHFRNPRWVRPTSIMPRFDFLSEDDLKALTAYVQSLGDEGDFRELEEIQQLNARRFELGLEDFSARVLFEPGSGNISNPVLPDERSTTAGKIVYDTYCIGCHGENGDGSGPAAPFLSPPPLDFTTPLFWATSDGTLYWHINKGLKGTAMEAFEGTLTPVDIWNAVNYIRTFTPPDARAAGEEVAAIKERENDLDQLRELQEKYGEEVAE